MHPLNASSPIESTPRIPLAASLLIASLLILTDWLTGTGGVLRLLLVVPVLVMAANCSMIATLIFAAGFGLASVVRPIVSLAGTDSRHDAVEAVCSTAMLMLVAVFAARLRAVAQREQLLARSDALTGAANSKSLRERLEAEFNRCSRSGRPLTLAFVDCDRFKQINDTLGHAIGDQVLRAIVTAMLANTRSYDVVARVGGDEFVVLLPEADERAARVAIERIQNAITQTVSADAQPVTVSIGVITDPHSTGSPDELLHAADQLMYAAKHKGPGLVEYDVRRGELVSKHL